MISLYQLTHDFRQELDSAFHPETGEALPAFERQIPGFAMDDALLTGVDDLVDQLVVEIAATPAGRFNVAVPLDVVDGLHQVGVDVRQLG